MRVAALAAATLGSMILLGLPSPAGADSDERAAAHRPPKRHRAAEILLDMNGALGADRAQSGTFRIRKRYGFEYAHRFDQGHGPPLIMSIQGPALPRKLLGVSIEFKF